MRNWTFDLLPNQGRGGCLSRPPAPHRQAAKDAKTICAHQRLAVRGRRPHLLHSVHELLPIWYS